MRELDCANYLLTSAFTTRFIFLGVKNLVFSYEWVTWKGESVIFHTYSSYARGLDILIGAYNWLDLTPKGRDEAGLKHGMAWVRHHDKYDAAYKVDTEADYVQPAKVTDATSGCCEHH